VVANVNMKLETDIHRIEELTRQNEDEDRRYRCLLKRCGLTTEEIDAIVHRHYRAVSEQIECQECGNCCKVFRPLLKAEDIDRLARRLRIPRADFIREYLDDYENGKEHSFKLTPCPFLADNACTVYPDRPDACRLYPGLHRKGFVLNLSLAFSSCSVCPLVYNVYERVKMEICDRPTTTLLENGSATGS
jgi:Fe-S-cluster containining protein